MIQPRNTMVLVKRVQQAERKVGAITVPVANECYCEAEVVQVGKGVDRVGGSRSDTYDLMPGQIVFVRHRRLVSQQARIYNDTGIPITFGGENYLLVEESDIGAILFASRAEYDQHLSQQVAPDKNQLILN